MSNLEIASDAYAYFYPVVENLKTLFFTSVWRHTREYLTATNVFGHATELTDWTFENFVSPNNDTLYSQAWLDLEEQPLVLSLPSVPTDPVKRYYSMQIVDGFTFNIKTISPRTTGSWEAAKYLIIGPTYSGPIPDNFDEDHIVRCSSRFTYVLGRTAVYGPDDIENVKKIQAGYTISPLQGSNARAIVETSSSNLPQFPFIDKAELASNSPEPQLFFDYVNFIMKYIKVPAYEEELYKKFAQIQVGPGFSFDGQNMSTGDYAAISLGIKAGSKKIDAAPLLENFGNTGNGWTGAINPPMFGTEEVMKGRYLTRANAARIGIYGNDPEEAIYVATNVDSNGVALDSTTGDYSITFPQGGFPPINDGAFWSITMYRLPERLFVHNVIDRYSIGDRTSGLVYGSDGSLKIYIQKEKPTTPEGVANWLPAPDPVYGGYDSGLFSLIARIYWPTSDALTEPYYFPPGIVKQEK